MSPRYAQLWGRCFRGVPVTAEPVPYVRGFKGVSLLPPTRAVLYPPEGGAARLSEDIEALRSLARFWHEVSATFWPQRG